MSTHINVCRKNLNKNKGGYWQTDSSTDEIFKKYTREKLGKNKKQKIRDNSEINILEGKLKNNGIRWYEHIV